MPKNQYGITVTQLLKRVDELTKTKPKAVYEGPFTEFGRPGCYYAKGRAGGRVGCIFGQALVDLGVPRKVLRRLESGDSDGRVEMPAIDVLLGELGVPVSQIQGEALGEIQTLQDEHNYWGSINVRMIYKKALAVYRRPKGGWKP